MSKLVYRICSNCGPSRPVKCNANNPAKSMANHQSRMKCYVSSQDAAVANMTTSVSQVIPGSFVAHNIDSMSCVNVDPGAMGMNIHILNQELNVPPFEDFANEEIFQDNPNRQPNFVLSSAMDTQSETDVTILENNSYGTTLVFLNENEEWIYKSNDSLQPSFKQFLFQKKLQEEFFGKLKRKRSVRNQRRTRQEIDEKIELKPVDPVVLDLIYVHSVKKGFTNSSIEDYLSLMDDITQTSFERTVNKTHWKTTKKNYDKFVNVFSPLKRPEYVLPPEMYGSDANGDPLRPYYGVSVDILEEISFSLLNVDNVQENFAFRYEEMKNCTGNRITGPFHTAERFKRLDKYVKKRHGEDAVPLCVVLYSDPTKLNPVMSRLAHPVYMYILNILGHQCKTIFIGYIPHGVHNSDVLDYLLTENKGINVKVLKNEILGCLKPSDMMRFFEFVLDPMFDYMDKGIVLQVGSDREAEVRRFIPFLVNLLGDHIMQDERAGCCFHSQKFSCCRCLTRNCYSFYRLPVADNLDIGSYVRFQYRDYHYESFISPLSIKSISIIIEGKRTVLTVDTLQVLHNDVWYNIRDHPDKVYTKALVKRRNSNIEYVVHSIQWNRALLVDDKHIAVNERDITDLTTIRSPLHGLCKFGLGGTWKNAVVVWTDENENKIDVCYDDGDTEYNIPNHRFIYLDGAPRNDDQMNMLAKGKLSILLRQIKHSEDTIGTIFHELSL